MEWRGVGVMWLIAGISSGVIAFFIVDPPTLAVFVAGAIVGILLGLACFLRPSPVLASLSAIAAIAWVVAFGIVTTMNITNPIYEVVSVVWIALFGGAAGSFGYRMRSRAGGERPG